MQKGVTTMPKGSKVEDELPLEAQDTRPNNVEGEDIVYPL